MLFGKCVLMKFKARFASGPLLWVRLESLAGLDEQFRLIEFFFVSVCLETDDDR
jgi:hypothetical protein